MTSIIAEQCLSAAAKEQELLSVAKLVDLAMQRLPAAFTGDRCLTAITMLMQLVPVFANTKLRFHKSCPSWIVAFAFDFFSLRLAIAHLSLLTSDLKEYSCRNIMLHT